MNPLKRTFILLAAALICSVLGIISAGCSKKDDAGVPKVIVLSPHSDNIKYEIEKGFKAYYKAKYGTDAAIDWRDIGGGGSSILSYIRNVYSRSETCGIDILFGAGETPHQYLAADGLLTAYSPAEDYLAAVPEFFGGTRLYGPDHLWHGVVLSSFGFIYNKQLLSEMSLDVPLTWQELGQKQYFGHIMLADPSQSSSIAAAYEMILQSEKDWPAAWEKLLNILSNAKKFTSSSSAAVLAPGIGEAVIATCIDYYGALAIEQAPEKLAYVSPKGGTGFTPDPISILKNAPNPETAKRFVDYVLSFEAQGLWALKPGTPGGPEKTALNRLPIRKDVYEKYGSVIPEWMARPYASEPITIDPALREHRYDVMIELIKAAAVDNSAAMMAARKVINATSDQKLKDEFYKLPDNVDTIDKIYVLHGKLEDDAFLQQLRSQWSKFYREKYANIIQN